MIFIVYIKPGIHYATCCIVLHSNRQEFYSMQHVVPKDQRKITSTLQHVAQCILALMRYTCALLWNQLWRKQEQQYTNKKAKGMHS